MSRGAYMFGTALLRWQFPDLDPRAAADAAVRHPEPEDEPPPAAPAANGDVAVADGGDDRDATVDHEAVAAAEIARGYAAGFAQGQVEGSDKGYAEGFAKGTLAAQEALAEETRRLAELAKRLTAPMPAVERIIEDALVGLALELARSVIGGEVARSRESLVGLIREALAAAPIKVDGISIALNPADLALIRSLAPDVEAGGTALVEDGTVETGGCLIIVDERHRPVKDRRWHPRASEGAPHIDLSLAARWRSAMLALFDGESA